MQIISEIPEVSLLCQKWRQQGEKIAFVPTMGNLHGGHLSLVKKAQQLGNKVVVSIFVNPLQFGEGEDFTTYPRTLDDDIQKLATYSPDALFTPDSESFYPEGAQTVQQIDVGAIAGILEGASRPGHFAGVATVVHRLFEIVQPDVAIFGEKDFQQVQVIRNMVRQFKLDARIVTMPTVREIDGLAMSSRNRYLSTDDRGRAAQIYQTLLAVKEKILHKNQELKDIEKQAMEELKQQGFKPDYVVIRDADTLEEPGSARENVIILLAAYLGNTRLIDNLRV